MFSSIRKWIRATRANAKAKEKRQEYIRDFGTNIWYLTNFGSTRQGEPFSTDWLEKYFPGLEQYAVERYDQGKDAYETALFAAHRVLITTVEQATPAQRQSTLQELKSLHDTPDTASFGQLTKAILVFYRSTDMWMAQEFVSAAAVDAVCKDIMGALGGFLDEDERRARRMMRAFEEILSAPKTESPEG